MASALVIYSITFNDSYLYTLSNILYAICFVAFSTKDYVLNIRDVIRDIIKGLKYDNRQ